MTPPIAVDLVRVLEDASRNILDGAIGTSNDGITERNAIAEKLVNADAQHAADFSPTPASIQ